MHQSIITRILDLAATKVAAQVTTDAGIEAIARQIDPVAISERVTDRVAKEINISEIIDQAADGCLAKLDQRQLAREVADRIDNRDLAHLVAENIDTDEIIEKAAGQIEIDDQDVIDKAATEMANQIDEDDVVQQAAERLEHHPVILDRTAKVLADRVCAALTPTDSTEKPQPGVAA